MSARYRFPVTFGQNWLTQQSHGLFVTAKLLVSLYIVFMQCSCFFLITSRSTLTRNGSTTSDVFGKVTPVESIYLLLQNFYFKIVAYLRRWLSWSRRADRRAAVCALLVSALRRRCDRVRSEIGRCSAVSELRGSNCMFTTMFDSNWLKTKTLAVSRVGWAVQAPGLHYSCGQRSCSDKAIICQHDTATHMCARITCLWNSDDGAVIL